MSLIYAILALNLAFVVYLFISLRSSSESFLDKASPRVKSSRMQVEQDYPFYDAFSHRQPLSRSNGGEY